MDHVVVIRHMWCRTLPELVVEVRRNGRGLAATDARARIGVPRPHEIRAANDAVPDRLERLEVWRVSPSAWPLIMSPNPVADAVRRNSRRSTDESSVLMVRSPES